MQEINTMKKWSKKYDCCQKCGEYVGINKLTMDHIIPISKGGIHHINNVQPLCMHCNSIKHNSI